MALRPIDIILRAQGQQQVQSAVQGVTSSVQKMGQQTQQSGTQAKNSLSQVVQGANQLPTAFAKAGTSAQQGMGQVTSSTNQAKQSLSGLHELAGKLATTIGANAGLGALKGLSNDLVKTSMEANAAQKKLEGMLAVRGESAALDGLLKKFDELAKKTGKDDDMFADATAHLLSFGLTGKQAGELLEGSLAQSITMGSDLLSVVDSLGRSYASLNAAGMRRSGVVLDQTDIDKIKDLKDAGKTIEAQKVLFEAVKKSFKDYAIDVSKGLDENAVKLGNFNTQWGNMLENIGAGSTEARAAWMGALTPVIEKLNEGGKGVESFTGKLIEYGKAAGSVAQPIFNLVQGLGMARIAFGGLKGATVADTIAEKAKAGVAAQEAGAIAGVGDAAAKTAGKVGLLARVGAGLRGVLGLGSVGSGAGIAAQVAGGLGTAATAGGVGIAGTVLGAGVYEGMHQAGLTETGAEEAAANASGRLMHFGQEGMGLSAYDYLVDKENRGDIAEWRSMNLFNKMRATPGTKRHPGPKANPMAPGQVSAAYQFAGDGGGMSIDSAAINMQRRMNLVRRAIKGGLTNDDRGWRDPSGLLKTAADRNLAIQELNRIHHKVNTGKAKVGRTGSGDHEVTLEFGAIKFVIPNDLGRASSSLPISNSVGLGW